MKIINRYILKSFLSNFTAYFCITTFLLLLSYLYQIINSLIIHRTNFITVIQLFLLLTPSIFSLTIPITILISTLLTFSLLNETGELLTLQTMGVKKSLYIINFVLFSLVMTAIMFYFNTIFVPKSYRQFRNIFLTSVISKPFINFNQNLVTIKNKKIVSQNVVQQEKNKYVLSNIYIYNPIDENNIIQTIFAQSANVYTNIQGDIVFDLQNGEILIFNKTLPTELTHLVFSNYKFIIFNEQVKKIFSQPTSLRELTNKELLTEFNNTKFDKHKKHILSEYFLRHTISFSVFTFTIIGILLGTKLRRNVKPLSFIIAIIIILFYYFTLSGSISVVERSQIVSTFNTAAVVMQIPNIVLLITSIFL
jgi:lipopolysaccharide export system permease protein